MMGIDQNERYQQVFWEAQETILSLADRYDGEDADVQKRYAYLALEVCRDCADAYVLLGSVAEEHDGDLERARELYENGVAAGERAVKKLRGHDAFKRDRGDFYAILETRGYVRARGSLALVLYQLGEREAAEEHARALLKLNEMDNLGLRNELARWLLEKEGY